MPTGMNSDPSPNPPNSYFAYMTPVHKAVFWLSIIGALAILAAMLFGARTSLESTLDINRTLRDVAIALWAFALPAFFVLEETLFAPRDPVKLAIFMEDQRKARAVWLFVGGLVAVMIGATAPDANRFRSEVTGNQPTVTQPAQNTPQR
ncbi:hypothetical protein ACFQS7_26665 [Dankookia sp. GCM10030260]|uniref:hypothetical protein n=1 Tax=Dankookia sp. GCM10030260 TaxID=3273390 RepID=UPI00360B6477